MGDVVRMQIGHEPREILDVKAVIEDLERLDPNMLVYKRHFFWRGGFGKTVYEVGNVNVKNVPMYCGEGDHAI